MVAIINYILDTSITISYLLLYLNIVNFTSNVLVIYWR